MTDPLLFTVSGAVAARAQPLTLAEAGLTERAHLQEWVLANPDILGSDVRVLSFEFDWWTGSGGSRERDRLDVLGIDTAGRLVVAELKRDRAPNTTDTQAIRYAAMASRFTSDTLAAAHARFLSARGEPTDADAALRVIEDHAGGELDTELLRRPRIVLVAADFPAALTASVVWLTEMGIRVELVHYRAYRAGGEVALVVSRLWPVADVEDFTVSPDAVEAASPAARSEVRRRAGSAVKRLVDAAALENGTVLELNATTEVDAEARDQIAAWVEADPERGRATWHNDANAPLEWHHDGQRYTPTGLARLIIAEATGMERGPRGTSWWITEDGDDLVALADTVAPTDSTAASRYQPRDWSDLHAALDALEPRQWTTYGDLAALIDSSARAVGQHVTSDCEDCATAYRVLNAAGRPAAGFRWTDPTETRGQREVLEAEGVRFGPDGRADPGQRVNADRLRRSLAQ